MRWVSDMNDFDTLKTRLADSAARSDIEVLCQRLGDNWSDWYETAPVADDADVEGTEQRMIDDAIAYLTVRGLIEVDETGRRIRFTRPPE